MLATSREALAVEGEHQWRVPSLSVDGPSSPAFELLVDRVGDVNESFEWDDDARAAAIQICRSLDGIPLAIELAAAQLGALAPRELLERLDNRFELLVGGRTRRRQRQQTLQAVMQWSWELLSDVERTVLRELSVFAGGWTLEAAEAVLARPGRPAVAGVLRSLVWKSLIEPVAGTSGRHRMLETVRLFAQERLAESGSAAEARDRHASWFVEWTQRQPTPKKLFSFDWLVEFRNDLDNIASAITWSVERSRWTERRDARRGRRWALADRRHGDTSRRLDAAHPRRGARPDRARSTLRRRVPRRDPRR